MHHLERYTSPELPARASQNRRSAPHAFGPRKRPGNSLHSKCARNGIHQTAGATLGRATDRSPIKMHNLERYTGLEWPIDARNRRNVLCACFSHAQTRPKITPYPKSARNGTSNSARNSGRATTARLSKCAISRSKHEPEAACPCTQPQKISAHVIWTRPKTRLGTFLQS